MPIDRNTHNNSRPLKPTLASNRTAKTPLTPRLALAPSTPATTTSQTGRPLRTANNVSTPRLAVAAPTHDDATPARPLLATNITPRSSARKTRVGGSSASSTPSGTPSVTPVSSRPASTVDFAHREHGHAQSGPAITAGNSAPTRPRSVLGTTNHQPQQAPRLPLSSLYNHTPPDPTHAKHASPMFFHANAARSPQEPALPQKKAPVFFHANGVQAEGPRKREAPSPPGSSVSRAPPSSVGRSQPETKFFHADSISDTKTPPLLTPPPLAPMTEFPLNATSTSTSTHGPSLRAPSPTKDWGHLSYRKGASQIIRPNMASRGSALSVLSGVSASDEPGPLRRRSSAASSILRASHGKSASLSSIDSVAELKQVPSNEAHPTLNLPQGGKRVTSNSSLPDNAAPTPSPLANSLNALHSPGPTSPLNGQSALEMMNELAANARRERKVLDLEISNSSLLAINRSLEKEVRKQKAELRRFRRMSRAGHFSVDSASVLDKGLSHTDDLSDMSEGEEEPPEEDVESSESSFDESVASDSHQAENDEAYRLRDEKRLQLDLSKHQDLLNDSQKMNQSLKRCLGWTDQLIKDAQKALDYKVRASDVQLGGRVLISEEDDDDSLAATHPEESRGLLSPWSPHRGADTLDLPTTTGRMENRDSGIDVGGLKRVHAHARSASDLPDDLTPLSSPFGEKLEFLHAAIDELEVS